MTSKNDITGDELKCKGTSDKYRINWDKIFSKEKQVEQEPTVTITLAEYSRLRQCESEIQALEACGVDNWSGYSDAMELVNREDF